MSDPDLSPDCDVCGGVGEVRALGHDGCRWPIACPECVMPKRAERRIEQLMASAKNVADWMKYLLDANPGLGRMCRSSVSNDGGDLSATQPVSMQSDYDALIQAMRVAMVEGKKATRFQFSDAWFQKAIELEGNENVSAGVPPPSLP